jgi:hypothetical protein
LTVTEHGTNNDDCFQVDMIEIDCMTVAKERIEEEKPYLERHLNP